MKLRNSQKGFTLLELLIVIMIIGILASIILPEFKGMQQEGEIVAAKGDLNTLKIAVESYYTHNERVYPSSLTELLSATPRIISSIPQDRFNKCCAYNYEVVEDEYYIIWSNGPNKKKDFQIVLPGPEIPKSSLKDDILATNIPVK